MKQAVLVLGASGGVGQGVVAALAEAGHPVLAVGREAARLDEVAARHAAVTPLLADLKTDADGRRLAETLQALRRPIFGAVAALGGGFARGRLLDHDVGYLRASVEAALVPHFLAARHLLPALTANRRGTPLPYLVMGGPCADNPWAGYGHLSVGQAALQMLVRALREELLDTPVRLQLLSVCSPVRTESNAGCACPEWPSSLEVGRRAVAALATAGANDAVLRYDAFAERRRQQAPGAAAQDR